VSPRLKNPQWKPMSTVPKDGSCFKIAVEIDGIPTWWTCAAWNEKRKLFYTQQHSNDVLLDINNHRFVGWLPMCTERKKGVQP